MDYIKFKLALRKIKISLRDFSTLIGVVHSTNLSKWKSSGVPIYASNFIELLEQLSLEQRAVFIARKLEKV